MTGQSVRAAFAILIATLCLPPARAAAQATEPTSTGSSLDELLEVKISGAAKSDQTARQAPASVTIITSEDIERYGYRTLADVLMTVRGFFVSYDRNPGHLPVRVLAQVRNLFDVDYSTPGGFEHRQAAIGQDGRNYAVRLEYRF